MLGRRGWERVIIGGGLAAIVVSAWVYLVHAKSSMAGMAGMAGMPGMDMAGMVMPDLEKWGLGTAAMVFIMWTVMMVAMMVPSATPMILAFVTVNERRRAAARPLVPVGIFLLGYLAVWTGYSALATVAQWGLHQAALLSSAMATTSTGLTGGLLIAAGVFQWTPLKRACLKGCRSPLSFLMGEWREGVGGAFVMGLRHGSYCVGCCWVLMALLFVVGVMNLFWVGVIALFMIGEKIMAKGELLGRLAGVALVIGGVVVIARHW